MEQARQYDLKKKYKEKFHFYQIVLDTKGKKNFDKHFFQKNPIWA